VHSVDQSHLCEPLGGTEGLIETVALKKRRWQNVCDEEQAWMAAGCEFPTEGGSNAETVVGSFMSGHVPLW